MSRRPLILVVEDNVITAKMMRVALETANYQILVAHDAESALRLVEQQKPDVMLQDLLLPDMDGIELLERVRRVPGAESLPVIVCSGLLSRMEDVRNTGIQFSDFLFKPVEIAQLLQTVSKHVPRKHSIAGARGTGQRILLLGDHRAPTAQNAHLLRQAGFTVTSVESVSDAMVSAEANPPDIFLLELYRPDANGLELCLLIRRHPRLHRIPVVVASAAHDAANDRERELALKMGANALVPLTSSLEQVIDALLAAPEAPATALHFAEADTVSDAFTSQLGVQLERQLALSYNLSRRLALDSTLMAVMTGATSLVNEHRDLNDVMTEVLTRTLDAGGVSSGAIFITQGDGTLQLRAQVGFPETNKHELQGFFGQAHLLLQVMTARKGLHLSGQQFAQWNAPHLPVDSGMPTILLEPLVARGEAVGVLVIGASRFESMTEWTDTVRTIGIQLAQGIALSQTLEALRASEEDFRSFFQGLPIAAFRAQPDGNLLDANATFLALFGFPAHLPPAQIEWPKMFDNRADRSSWQQFVNEGGSARTFETSIRTVDGQQLWVAITARVVRREDGEISHFEGALVDITQRRNAERQLAESEAYFRQLFEANPFPMLVVDGALHHILASNEAAGTFFERPSTRLVDLPLTELLQSPMHLQDGATWLQSLQERPGHFVARYRRLAGEFSEMEVTSRNIQFSGRRAHLILVHDVTERELLQRQVVQAQKMEAIGLLAGGVAHDFNNLLTVMKSCAAMLMEDLSPEAPGREDAAEIVAAAERATVLTRQLLAFSSRQVLDAKPVAVNVVISDLERMLRRLIPTSIEFELELDADAGLVLVDPGQFEQVIVNLVVNARDAMPQGGSLRISTQYIPERELSTVPGARAGAARQFVHLCVCDSGCGMDEETRARVFEPFFTTKPRGQGTGLGLSTVYGIVSQSGGHIRVETAPDKGTRFHLYFPRVISAESSDEESRSVPVPSMGNETVLVVEDEEAVRRVVSRTLRSLGYTVLEARHADQALEMARDFIAAPHLIISDVVMPRMNGFDLVTQLHARWPAMRVLFMSGYSDLPERETTAMVKMSFIQKPFLPGELGARVRAVLNQPSGS